MATDGATPPACDPEIFNSGQLVCKARGRSSAIEQWVKAIAEKANARVDWHYSGGIAHVLHLGDEESYQRVINVMHQLQDEQSIRWRSL